jgi:hypothetical protein
MTSPYGSGTEDRRGSARSRITAATHATPTRAPCASEDISRLDGLMHESPHLFDWQMRRRSCDNERARSESPRDCQRCRVAKSEMIRLTSSHQACCKVLLEIVYLRQSSAVGLSPPHCAWSFTGTRHPQLLPSFRCPRASTGDAATSSTGDAATKMSQS